MTKDYLREIDLNPPAAAGGPITNPLDPRAMHYFGFTSSAQAVTLSPPFAGTPRVLVSFHHGNQPTAVPPQPQPPIDGVVDNFASPFGFARERHNRAHVLVWLDPVLLPPPGQPTVVRVSAWAED